MTLDDEQQLAWSLLSGNHIGLCMFADPETIALTVGKNISIGSNHHDMFEECLTILMDRGIDSLSIARILRTWLVDYGIKFNPETSKVFDRFHKVHGAFIVNAKEKFEKY